MLCVIFLYARTGFFHAIVQSILKIPAANVAARRAPLTAFAVLTSVL